MELGIGMFGDNHFDDKGKAAATGQRLRELISEIKLADEVGLDFVGIGEHHRPDYSVSVPEIVLAGAATVTRNIKLGSAVTVLSSADPVLVYQQYATIDHLSNGRAEITAGRGSFTESFPVYGYDLRDYEALFEEKLDLLNKIRKEDPITWKGNHRAPLHAQSILPRSQQQPLPLWVAVGGTPESVVRAAKLGLPVIFAIIGGNPAQFRPLFDYFRKAWAHFGHREDELQVGVHMHAFFGDDDAATADSYYPHYAAQMNRVGATRGWPPYQRNQFEAGRGTGGHLLIGDPNAAIDKILAFKEMFGLTRFAAHIDVGGPGHKDLMRCIEIYGTYIAPAVRSAIGEKTSPDS